MHLTVAELANSWFVTYPAVTLWSTFHVSPGARHGNSRHLDAVRVAAGLVPR